MPSAAGPSSSSTIRDGTRMPTRQSHPKQPSCHASVFHNRLIYMRKKSELRRVRKPVRAAGQILTGPARQFMPPGRPPAAEKAGALALRTGMGPACLEAGRVRPCFSRAARGRRHAAGSRTLQAGSRSVAARGGTCQSASSLVAPPEGGLCGGCALGDMNCIGCRGGAAVPRSPAVAKTTN